MKKLTLLSSLVILSLLVSACGLVASLPPTAITILRSAANNSQPISNPIVQTKPNVAQATPLPPVAPIQANSLLAAYEATLENVYAQVSPSVVNIRVVLNSNTDNSGNVPNIPNIPGFPTLPQLPQTPQFGQALGSGFVWDQQGNIVTNNHVVEGANKIDVTFSDGTVATGKVVATDPYSDLAVVKVDMPADQLRPVQMADSRQTKVGELTIAIGNPFGLAGTMTTGIISALGRTYPVDSGILSGPSYSIPDVIQTDAPINPGNSGGVLVNDQGQVLGVTFAIESSTRSSSGIGFVIPSAIVEKVIPSLIQNGKFDHPYIGISGAELIPDLATAMGLKAGQRGALIEEVTANGPAAKAGLNASTKQVDINGTTQNVGGDVITAIDGQPVKSMDDLISYLSDSTTVGQKVTLTILRDGKEMKVDVTLGVRPSQATPQPTSQSQSQPQSSSGNGWMGITGTTLNTDLAQAMGIATSQQGVLVEQVDSGGPAETAGLRGSDTTVDINGQQVQVGGDVITTVDGQSISSMSDLMSTLQGTKPGQKISLTVLRDGNQITVDLTLGSRP